MSNNKEFQLFLDLSHNVRHCDWNSHGYYGLHLCFLVPYFVYCRKEERS